MQDFTEGENFVIISIIPCSALWYSRKLCFPPWFVQWGAEYKASGHDWVKKWLTTMVIISDDKDNQPPPAPTTGGGV